MYIAVTQYILGIKPALDGLSIDPCIPGKWEGFTVNRRFRGCLYEIVVRNERGVCKGIMSITVDGEPLLGNVIPVYPDRERVCVQVVM